MPDGFRYYMYIQFDQSMAAGETRNKYEFFNHNINLSNHYMAYKCYVDKYISMLND